MPSTRTKKLLLSLKAVLTTPGPVWMGWLACPEGDKDKLVELGVVVGDYKDGEYEVALSDKSCDLIQPYWGKWIWGLVRYTEEEASA